VSVGVNVTRGAFAGISEVSKAPGIRDCEGGGGVGGTKGLPSGPRICCPVVGCVDGVVPVGGGVCV
jgi:hypothetical protein